MFAHVWQCACKVINQFYERGAQSVHFIIALASIHIIYYHVFFLGRNVLLKKTLPLTFLLQLDASVCLSSRLCKSFLVKLITICSLLMV